MTHSSSEIDAALCRQLAFELQHPIDPHSCQLVNYVRVYLQKNGDFNEASRPGRHPSLPRLVGLRGWDWNQSGGLRSLT